MTTAEIIAYYQSLLILQYIGQPNATAEIGALVTPAVMDQIALSVQAAYTISTAVGVQLDVIGKYAGVNRQVLTFNGLTVLSDADFRVLINIKIIQNNSGSSLYDIQTLLNNAFGSDILVFDYQNMQMDYFFNSALGSQQLAEAFVLQGLLPKPMAVQLGSLIYAANITNFFGFRTYLVPGHNVAPFNSYSSYSMTAPWLSYANAI